MNHIGTKTIETQRLILRKFTMEDAEPMFRNWASDPEVTKYLTWPPHASVEVSEMVLTDWVGGYERPDFYQWAIVLKETGEPIGSISGVKINEKVGSAHIGYCIGKAFWHRGYMSEALKSVIGFFFDEVGASRVDAAHDVNNPHSGGVMRKCGMQYEGTLRQFDWNNQGICDLCWYGILAREHK